MSKQIGSQYRETLAEAGYQFVKAMSYGEVVLRNEFGCEEVWVKNDHFAGHVIEISGEGYEFVRSGDR
jgi:hypothetical protein